jgi:putative transposase
MSKPAPLRPGAYYHIYNRGTNRENLFREERNYAHFLKLYARHVEPSAETFAYCLLKNHFHLLVRIKDYDPKGFENPSSLPEPSQAFSNLFNAYTKGINKAYARTGSLFEHPFERLPVTTTVHFCRLVTYIHHNPQRHRLVDDFRAWKYSSYHALTTRAPTRLQRQAVLGWFNTPQGLLQAHRTVNVESDLPALAPRDFD